MPKIELLHNEQPWYYGLFLEAEGRMNHVKLRNLCGSADEWYVHDIFVDDSGFETFRSSVSIRNSHCVDKNIVHNEIPLDAAGRIVCAGFDTTVQYDDEYIGKSKGIAFKIAYGFDSAVLRMSVQGTPWVNLLRYALNGFYRCIGPLDFTGYFDMHIVTPVCSTGHNVPVPQIDGCFDPINLEEYHDHYSGDRAWGTAYRLEVTETEKESDPLEEWLK